MAARLLIIGGAERHGTGGTAILGRFVELAGGATADIVIIATASGEPAVLEAEYAQLFTGLGAGQVRGLRITTRAQANDAAVVEALAPATGIFFTGGDQLRITTVLGGTLADSALQTLVQGGTTVLGGTSAGAAMMSGTMILGGEAPGLTRAGVRTGPGLEFLPGVVIDMHFAERGRLNRLLTAVALYPHELGLGIDEDTAILADGDRFQVLGSGTVTVVDAGAATDIRVPAEGPIAFTGARIHVLPAGSRFELSSRCPSIPGAAGERGAAR
ncbi:cyanophycinase [Actinoplanes sp. NBRC 14428]|uniref:Cyanophycinase n=1 Tax=Pseudosporangium ferrugineum TaxID=439699 RepID=A0A2T0S2A8_9ACTN|nr:cyanophycinase [Pseudosporangium ferrugineum]PRY27551.1 cyanophycinase [Pseudosporangium ferrugineum]BCJ55681.1 cyanophycinase [Actinoplanes sp. NBRC 14428]